jgi:hypothetical protein
MVFGEYAAVFSGDTRLVDGELFKVGSTVTVDLRVQVGENAALQKGIVSEVDATNNMSHLKLRMY